MNVRSRWLVSIVVGFVLVFTACTERPLTGAEAGRAELFHPDDWSGVQRVPQDVFDPIEAGEAAPFGFRQVFDRDGIPPVYAPNFVSADEVDWPSDELIVGVELGGEARAYPVGFLNRREIVVDVHRGVPTFVTW